MLKKNVVWLIGIFLLTAILYSTVAPQKYIMYPKRYSKYVQKYAQAYGIEENLVYAVIKAESGFYPYAHSSKGAMGLMQITEGTLEWIGEQINLEVKNPYDIEKNIQAGTWYLAKLKEQFDDIDLMIIAYNAGPGKTKEWIKDGTFEQGVALSERLPYEETKNYIIKVKKYYEKYNHYYP